MCFPDQAPAPTLPSFPASPWPLASGGLWGGALALACLVGWASPAQASWEGVDPPRDVAAGPASTVLPSAPFLALRHQAPTEAMPPEAARAWALLQALWAHPELRLLDPGYLIAFQGARADLSVQARAFVGPDEAWAVALEAQGPNGRWHAPFWRYPTRGYAMASSSDPGVHTVLQAPMEVSAWPWRLRLLRPNGRNWSLPVAAPSQRLGWAYMAGPAKPQTARAWGLAGMKLVRLDGAKAPAKPRFPHPVLVVGGDFLYERIEDLVRFLRCQGVEAWGIRPDYGRPGFPPLTQIAREDAHWLGAWLQAWTGQRPYVMQGLCLGGVMARGYEQSLRQAGLAPRVAALGTVGSPHLGAPLADWYNDTPWVQGLHRLVQQDPRWAQYHDSEANMVAFNQDVPLPAGLPTRWVALDAVGRKPEGVYLAVDPALRLHAAFREGLAPWALRTDGMLPVSRQAPRGRPDEDWPCFHKGMLNLGSSARDFDAYAAHLRVVHRLQAMASEGPSP